MPEVVCCYRVPQLLQCQSIIKTGSSPASQHQVGVDVGAQLLQNPPMSADVLPQPSHMADEARWSAKGSQAGKATQF